MTIGQSASFSQFQPVCAILRYELLAGDPSTSISKEPPRQGAFNGPIILKKLVKVRNEGFKIEALTCSFLM
jgi:hypothetical protein